MGGKRKKHKPKYKPKLEPSKLHVEPSQSPLLVFVSSRITTMREERDTVARTIKSFTIARPWLIEYTPASSLEVRESYMSMVPKCDIFVIVLAFEYSEEVEREYRAAIETQKPILAFIHNGEREAKQVEFVNSITKKRNIYNDLADLSEQVWAAIHDQVILMARASDDDKPLIRPQDTPNLIEKMPLHTKTFEDMSGYVILGMENPEIGSVLKAFGATEVPEDIISRNPQFEPLFIDNIAEMQEAFDAIKNASARIHNVTNDRQKAFVRELKREATKVAMRYAMREVNKEPTPRTTIPELEYFIWGVSPDFARLVSLMRPEQIVKGPTPIKRTAHEFLFKDIDHVTEFFEILTKVRERSAGDDDEFGRQLKIEMVHYHFSKFINEQEDNSE